METFSRKVVFAFLILSTPIYSRQWLHSASAGPSTLLTNLVSYWPFNGNANDVSGNGRHWTGTTGNAPTYTSGLAGRQALTKDNSGELFQAYNAVWYPTAGYTVSAWFIASDYSAVPQIIGNNDQFGGGFNWGIWSTSHLFNRVVTVGGGDQNNPSNSGGTASLNNWHHGIWKWDPANNLQIVIVDGGAAGSATGPGGAALVDNGGRTTFGNVLPGQIQDAGFWNKVTTSTEDACLYGSGTPPAYPWTGICN